MNKSFLPEGHPINPEFGRGVYRRRIRLSATSGEVIAELEDCNHGFRVAVSHDGKCVKGISPEALRVPLTTCPSAVGLVRDLIGTPLQADITTIAQSVNPKANCTHLYDLTVLAIHHALRREPVRQYDIAIPDEDGQPTTATIHLNGKLILSWTIQQWQLFNPELAGVNLAMRFGDWASRQYQGDEREAAFALQKGYLVSNARRFDMNKLQGTPVTVVDAMLGVCYSYTSGTIEKATRTLNATRDFSDTEDQLLQFL